MRTVQMILERNNVATILFCLHKLGVPSGYASSHFAHASSHRVRILLMCLRIFRILLRILRILLRILRILLRILRIKARLGPIELNRLIRLPAHTPC
jgi:hypothetical protein